MIQHNRIKENPDHSHSGKVRIEWIDISKGIGIISVLIGHNITPLMPLIYSFHMPLFFILSGYTLHEIDKKDFARAELKDLRRLLIPCLFAWVIIVLWDCMIKGSSFPAEIRNMLLAFLWGNHCPAPFGMDLPRIGRVWFFIALFVSKFLYRLTCFNIEKPKRICFLLFLTLLGFILNSLGIYLPWCIDLAGLSMLFMETGSYLKEYGIEKIHPPIILCLFAFWTYFGWALDMGMRMNERKYPGYGLCILIAIAGSVCVFKFSQSIESLSIKIPLVFLGKNTIVLFFIDAIAPCLYPAQDYLQKGIRMSAELLLTVLLVYLGKAVRSKITLSSK